MVEQGQGRLVLVSSVSGLVGAGGLSIYSAAKGGVIAFAKSLAREFASKGISPSTVWHQVASRRAPFRPALRHQASV